MVCWPTLVTIPTPIPYHFMFIVIFTKLMLLPTVIIVYTDCIDIVVDHVPYSEYIDE